MENLDTKQFDCLELGKQIRKAEFLIRQARFVRSNMTYSMKDWDAAHNLFWDLMTDARATRDRLDKNAELSSDEYIRLTEMLDEVRGIKITD